MQNAVAADRRIGPPVGTTKTIGNCASGFLHNGVDGRVVVWLQANYVDSNIDGTLCHKHVLPKVAEATSTQSVSL